MKKMMTLLCATCGKTFQNAKELKAHRHVGPCMSKSELLEANWKRNSNQVWRKGAKKT